MKRAASAARRQWAIGLVSAALLSYQLALLQLLATSQWHHFAYLVISVALLGFGVSGTLLALFREWLLVRLEALLPICLLACSVCLVAPQFASWSLFGQFDSYLLFVSLSEAARLLLFALLLMLPFACGALAVGLVLTAETEQVGRYYCANLIGSGAGCFLGLAGLELLFPEQLIPVCALLALSAALLLSGRRLVLLGGGSLLLIIYALLQMSTPPLSQYKDLQRTLDMPGAEVVYRQPGADGQVHLVQAPQLRSATAVSLNWQQPLPKAQAVFSNGDRVGSLLLDVIGDSPDDAATQALPYAVARPQRVLVLGASTGEAVRQALRQGATYVTAVEGQTTITEVLQMAGPDSFADLLVDPRVDWKSSAPRTWLARQQEEYDLIILPTVGSFGGSSGLFALNEQPLLTVQALQQAYRLLSRHGQLAVTVWLDYPLRRPLRLLASLVETLEAEGGDPLQQLLAIRGWGTLTFCVMRDPPSALQLSKLRNFAEQWSFDPALLPGLQPTERQRYHQLQDDRLFELFDRLLSAERRQLYRDYNFRIEPVSDDRPFFAQFLRWDRVGILTTLYGQRNLPFIELGLLIAGLATLILLLLSLLLILLPIWRLPKGEGGFLATLLYFSGLGLGYMWLELALIHSYSFYLGQPVPAMALVVGVLLLGSGCGSRFSEKLSAKRPGQWAGLVALLLCVYALLLGPLQQATLHFTLTGRCLLGGLLLVPLAFLMGLPFPLGLRQLAQLRPPQVPWAWGINSCLSVVGAAIATLIVVESGFRWLLLLSAVAYLLPLSARLSRKKSR